MDSNSPLLNLVVIYGGQSAEHDVSCVTAAHVIKALDSSKYDITAVGITREGKWVVAQPQADVLVADGEPTSITPIVEQARGDARTVIFPLLHGPLGEDGTIQGVLELANIAYVGTGVLGSAVAMDKGVAKQVLHANGIPQPKYVSLREAHVNEAALLHAADTLGLPVFVKPANMGSSVGVSKAHDFDELVAATDIAMTYDEWLVFEEAIVGREIEVAVLGSHQPQASVAGEIVPGHEFYDYEDKYLSDGAQLMIPAPLSAAQSDTVRQLAIEVFHALRGEGLARVDFFFEENGRGFLCNEVNTMPGFTPISMYPKLWMATGVSYSDLIDRLVELARERHSRRRRNTGH